MTDASPASTIKFMYQILYEPFFLMIINQESNRPRHDTYIGHYNNWRGFAVMEAILAYASLEYT
ncbi:hypothetical protein HanIR_Chr09g0403791 [Helianthus annuus]|nr:hypothetical protein HanIR_Chr09g0403791 [Helianthus annuus]